MCFILLPSSFHICTYLLEVKVNRQQSGCLSCNLSQARKREREVNTAWHALCHTIKRLLVRGPDLHQKNIQPQTGWLDKIWPGHGLISSSRSVSLRLHWCWTSVEEFFLTLVQLRCPPLSWNCGLETNIAWVGRLDLDPLVTFI